MPTYEFSMVGIFPHKERIYGKIWVIGNPVVCKILESVNKDSFLNKENFAKPLTVTQKCDSIKFSDNDINKLVRDRGIIKAHRHDDIII